MSSASVLSIFAVILCVILIDVFCDDVTNSRSSHFDQIVGVEAKGTTPWPSLRQRYTTAAVSSSQPGTVTTTSPGKRRWIQQNNVWIKNEQASDGGGIGSSTSRPTTRISTRLTAKPPLNRGDTFIISKPQTGPVSPKPMSYAGALGSNDSPLAPNPQVGTTKDKTPSPGPTPQENTADNAGAISDSDVTDDELREFSESLLKKDSNNAMKHVTLNLQGMTSSRVSTDKAPLPLMEIDAAAYKIPSIEKLLPLYNNYFLEASQNEVYTGAERIEENNLLDTVLATPVMQFARSFLIQKGKLGKDPKEFRDLLRVIWFNMYSRGQGRIGSSGFEHVFLAEIKKSQVSGLHNWLYFNEEENQKRANYLGYMKKLDLGEKGAILKYHFTFHDIDKPVGSMFIGTSPELEMALYSTCFVLRADRICALKMNGNRFVIRTYTYKYRGKSMIGSAFPEI